SVEQLSIVANEVRQSSASAQRLTAAELQNGHRHARALEMERKRRKPDVARLRVNRVTFPAKIAEAHAETAKPRGQQRFLVTRFQRGRDVGAADECDDVAFFQLEMPGGESFAPHRE